MEKTYKYNFLGVGISVLITEVLFWSAFLLVYFVVLRAVPSIRLSHPALLWGLASGPIMALIFLAVSAWKNRTLEKFSDPALLQYLVPDISTVNAVFKFIFYRLGIAFLVIALVNPKSGSKMAEATYRGIDVMLAIDVSNSMLAEDIQPNRLKRATRAIEGVLNNLHGDRIGIIVFAGQAFVQLPITTDYAAGKLFLNSINTDIVPVQGTAIGSAIDLSMESFNFDEAANKAIIVITDGENHEDDAVAAAKKAAEKNVKVYTIGMGSEEGAPIPEFRGNQRLGYKKDKAGNTVVSKLNDEVLREIAEAGNGRFIRASSTEVGLNMLMQDLNEIEKTEYGSTSYSDYEDRFQIFLLIGLLFIFLEFLISEKKGFISRTIKMFD